MFTTTKELAQALREAHVDPTIEPIYGPFTMSQKDGGIGACAAGAIIVKAGFDGGDSDWEAAIPAFRIPAIDPVTGGRYDVLNCVIRLWENHGWNWAQIADWLEGLPEPENWPLQYAAAYTDEVTGTGWNS